MGLEICGWLVSGGTCDGGDYGAPHIFGRSVVPTAPRPVFFETEFGRTISVAKGTLLNREHGRRHLISPAQVLLAMIAKRPSLVGEVLS